MLYPNVAIISKFFSFSSSSLKPLSPSSNPQPSSPSPHAKVILLTFIVIYQNLKNVFCVPLIFSHNFWLYFIIRMLLIYCILLEGRAHVSCIFVFSIPFSKVHCVKEALYSRDAFILCIPTHWG